MFKKCTPLWRESHLKVKMLNTSYVRTVFGSCDVEQLRPVVVRSTFRSKKMCQKLAVSDHVWTFRCRKRYPQIIHVIFGVWKLSCQAAQMLRQVPSAIPFAPEIRFNRNGSTMRNGGFTGSQHPNYKGGNLAEYRGK